MKIIIAGAGAVGTHLAKLLSRENHDIVVIEEDADRLNTLTLNFDLLGKEASPTSIAALKSVGVENADLVIGVTPDENKNLTCCMLASKMGAKKTVARIETREFLEPKNMEFFKSVGVHSLILPEMLAAQEIASSVQRSWIRQWWEIENGALILMGIKIRQSCKILNKCLKDLSTPEIPFHIVAIKRGNETIIPNGNDMLKPFDLAYFMTTKRYIPYVREVVGKDKYPDIKNVLIMGGGTTSVYTTEMLPDYMNVKIIEKDKQRCIELTQLIDKDNVMVIHGDGRDLSLLADENLDTFEAFVSLTPNSETNILSCLSAKRMNMNKTVAILDKVNFVGMAESLDIGTIINKQAIAAGHIYQMMLKADVSNVRSLVVANADVAEFNVGEKSKIIKKQVKDINLPNQCTLGGLVRDGQGILINGSTQIIPGDHVVAFCVGGNAINKLSSYFQ